MVYISPTHCQVCGRIRNQHVNHQACAKQRQQQYRAKNKLRQIKQEEARKSVR